MSLFWQVSSFDPMIQCKWDLRISGTRNPVACHNKQFGCEKSTSQSSTINRFVDLYRIMHYVPPLPSRSLVSIKLILLLFNLWLKHDFFSSFRINCGFDLVSKLRTLALFIARFGESMLVTLKLHGAQLHARSLLALSL